MSIKKAYNFIQINERVSTSGTIKHIELKKEGYHLFVNLLPNDSEHARNNEQQEVEGLKINYSYIPVDWNNPLITDYKDFEEVMNRFSDKKIHIHCAANYRVTAFYGIYAYNNLGWSKAQLFELISRIWNIEEYSQWLKFITALTKND
jgi:protein tyrosine phosphatase (PTP) superfamily phosphohydrolase (DUF442 family)